MRALVTGGSGFVGRHLVAELERLGHDVLAPRRDELELASGRGIEEALGWLPDVVFHLAALSDPALASREPERAEAVNHLGSARLAEAVRGAGALLVHVSTCHVYGVPDQLPLREDHPLRPRGVYATTKAAGEQAVRASGARALVVRPFHLAGPGQPLAHAPADWAAQARGGAEVIRVGDLRPRRDYLDVRDAARAICLLAGRGQVGAAYNVCRGRSVEMGWILRQVAPGVPHEQRADRLRKLDVPELVGDVRALRALGWRPEIPLERSLEELREGG